MIVATILFCCTRGPPLRELARVVGRHYAEPGTELQLADIGCLINYES